LDSDHRAAVVEAQESPSIITGLKRRGQGEDPEEFDVMASIRELSSTASDEECCWQLQKDTRNGCRRGDWVKPIRKSRKVECNYVICVANVDGNDVERTLDPSFFKRDSPPPSPEVEEEASVGDMELTPELEQVLDE
jgi:hypothetical protein